MDFRLMYLLYFISLHCLLLAVLSNSSHVTSNRSTGHFILIYFVLEYSQLTNNVVIVSGEEQRDLAIHIRGSQVIFLKPCVLPPCSSHCLDCFDSQSSHGRSLFENNQPLANKPVHLKGNQSWIFIGRTDVEAETPILWPPDAKS